MNSLPKLRILPRLCARALLLSVLLFGVFAPGREHLEAAPEAGPEATLEATPGADAILGIWTVSDGDMKIEVYACKESSKYCGRIAWMKEPTRPGGEPRVDSLNPNPKKRSTGLLGMEILWGLSYENGKWVNGQIYKVAEGKTYKCSIVPQGSAELQVHSFVGIAALGKRETWTR
ncbi:MAG: DUF2147 domain-containing protein [Leptospirales bacterium]|jgi:uncharacterized protein (DUF2147 family)